MPACIHGGSSSTDGEKGYLRVFAIPENVEPVSLIEMPERAVLFGFVEILPHSAMFKFSATAYAAAVY